MNLPSKEIKTRIKTLQKHLTAQGINLALVMQNVDQYYYTGTMQDGVLVVPSKGPPVLFIRRT
ncbi:MAG: aminopeptidase P family N-terminal domain-containing protein, partial [Spirochaetota bacterium]